MASVIPRKKVLVVGDGAAGKTCLLVRFHSGVMPSTYIPTTFDVQEKLMSVGGKPIELSLWDTAGQETHQHLRPLCYNDTDVVIICFAIDSPTTLSNVTDIWLTEMRHYCKGAPIILVGCKADLRRNQAGVNMLVNRLVTAAEGEACAKRIGAFRYCECSALTGEGVNFVFESAARLLLASGRSKSKGQCVIL
ncbi:GTP-binding protein Rho1 [Phlyctochytrium bullatum]|nr:GTP-binding protein Rho1 [Phlyctochytrium bullatum]